MQHSAVATQNLDGIGTDVQAGARLRVVAGVDLFQAKDLGPGQPGKRPRDDAAGNAGANDDNFHGFRWIRNAINHAICMPC